MATKQRRGSCRCTAPHERAFVWAMRLHSGIQPQWDRAVRQEGCRMAHTKTIMIVEDDEAIRTLAHAVLSACGYGEVLTAENAAQALEVSAKHPAPIHLLLSDVMMRGELDGRDLARKMSEERPDVSGGLK